MVLIVEDEAISRRALQQLLRLSGYETFAAASAEEALKYLATGPLPEIALLDIDLPGMSGIDLAEKLSCIYPSIVPVFITASDEDRIQTLLMNAREGHFFRKPLDINMLLNMMHGIAAA